MYLLGTSILLLEYIAFSQPSDWNFRHPKVLYAWEGGCVWIPCSYTPPGYGQKLENLTVYHNYNYNKTIKEFVGTILDRILLPPEKEQTRESGVQQKRIQFLGDHSSNCTLRIHPVGVNDSGKWGLRMMTKEYKYMEAVTLNISETAPPPSIQRPSTIKEFLEVTLTCSMNTACFGYQIELRWSLKGPTINKIELTDKKILTQSQLSFKPQWEHHGKNVTCQLWDLEKNQLLSETSMTLDVQHSPKQVMTVIQTPTRIREGDNVTVSCQYNSSNPKVTYYQWNSIRSQGSSRELKIYNVAWDHKAVACAACNGWCSWSPEVNLHVQYAPRDVTVQLSSTRPVHLGTKLVLRCRFSSSNPATVSFLWKKNGILKWQEQELHFDAITPEDSGMYHCEVNNSIGRTQSPAQVVSVLYAPRRLHVTFSPQSSVVEGKMVVLRCEGEANPSIYHYAWFDWNNQDLHHYEQTLRLEPVTIQHSGAYWCQGINELGQSRSPLTTLTVHYSSKTIAKQVGLGLAMLLIVSILLFWVIKLQQRKRIQSQQGLQENSSGQSFFVRNTKVRGTPLAEGPPSLGCYNPVMEEATSYAVLNFPDTPRTGNSGTSGTQRPSPNWTDTVTYSVVQKPKRPAGDYENLSPDALEEEDLHYSELVRFGAGVRSPEPEAVEYVTLKH